MKGRIFFIPVLTLLLICLNFFLLYQFPAEIHRWGRVMISASFLICYILKFKIRNTLLFGSFILFLLADTFALHYDLMFPKQAFFILQSLAYFIMLYGIKNKIRNYKIRGIEKWFFRGVLVVNSIFVLVIGSILSKEVNNSFLEFLFYFYGVSAVLLISAGVIYYNKFFDNQSTAFMLSGIGLVFSNITGFSAHFLQYFEFFYLDRFLYALGVAFWLHFISSQIRIPEEQKGTAKKDFFISQI